MEHRADQRSIVVEQDPGKDDLAAVGRHVVVAAGVHPVEPADRVGRQVAQRAGGEVEHEEMRRLAGREPGVPVAVEPLLGDLGLHGILVAALDLGPRGLRREVAA